MDCDYSSLRLTMLEVRILGAMIEKSITTPDYYPLTVNALLAACNQKNNRNPVLTIDGESLEKALYNLQSKRLVEFFSGANARVLKYREHLTKVLQLTPQEQAVICVLLLRGPQTPGELRNRTARLYPFNSLEEVQSTLQGLVAYEPEPLVMELPRQPGQKECRFAHLLGEDPIETTTLEAAELPLPPAMKAVVEESEREAALESRVAQLEEQVVMLQQELATFKAQFE